MNSTLLLLLFLVLVVSPSWMLAEGQYEMKEEEPMALPSVGREYSDVEELKLTYSGFQCDWIEFDGSSGGNSYVACIIVHPAYGSSRHEVRGWLLDESQKAWKIFALYKIGDLGLGSLVYDSNTSKLEVVGAANNKFKDVIVLSLQAE